LAVPDVQRVRERLRGIMRTALDREGVTFTFDLPAILRAEAQNRGLPVQGELSAYLQQGLEAIDGWGTSVRARSAQAAAQFRRGDFVGAFEGLRQGASLPPGFAGYAALTMLSLANRCHEFGNRVRPAQPAWPVWQQTAVPVGHGALADVHQKARQ